MNIDVARFYRLKGAVQAAADSVPKGQEAMTGKAMADTYDSLRDEVRSAIPSEVYGEYHRLFPKLEQSPLSPDDTLESAQAASAARTKLVSLAGWLAGAIEGEQHGE